jgi:polyisoprenoid-binding protein YceI
MATWKIDPSHSRVGFTVRHLLFTKVHGAFTRFSGEIEHDEKTGEFSAARARIEVASIDTAEPKRDEHLRSNDFFDAGNHPLITFESVRVDAGKLYGDLTIRGVTKTVIIDVEELGRMKDPWGGQRVAFTGKLTIDRKDYGVSWNQTLDAGGLAVGDKVEIVLEVQAVAPQVQPSSEVRA